MTRWLQFKRFLSTSYVFLVNVLKPALRCHFVLFCRELSTQPLSNLSIATSPQSTFLFLLYIQFDFLHGDITHVLVEQTQELLCATEIGALVLSQILASPSQNLYRLSPKNRFFLYFVNFCVFKYGILCIWCGRNVKACRKFSIYMFLI